MILLVKSVLLLLFCDQFIRCPCSVWENIPCSADEEQTMPEGIVKNVERFPWLGIIQHSFSVGDKRSYAISGAVLIHSAYAIASAEDVSKISFAMLVNNTELIFWTSAKQKFAIPVKDYILHPEYIEGITMATIALVSIINPLEADFSDLMAPVKPICMPSAGIGTYNDMYAVKFTDASGDLQKEVFEMTHVDTIKCEEFYVMSEVHYGKMNPTNPLCAVSVNSTSACIWDSGTVLITRQSWGFWQLIGFSTRGPGCGAPSKFLNIMNYMAWINDIIQEAPFLESNDDNDNEVGLGFRRLSPTKLVFYPNSIDQPRYIGECKEGDRGRVLYKDSAQIVCNSMAQGYYLITSSVLARSWKYSIETGCGRALIEPLTHNYKLVKTEQALNGNGIRPIEDVSVTADASFHCGEVILNVDARTNAVMWVEHHCHRDMEGQTRGHVRTGELEKLECFLYYKSTAYIEFKFIFSFKAEITVAMYGRLDKPSKTDPFWKLTTTNWWPTQGKLKMSHFYPEEVPYWDMG